MFETACRQVVNAFGKNTLIPVRSLDEQDKVKPLQLVVMKKKRKFFNSTKYSYCPTGFQLTEILEDKSPISAAEENKVLCTDYQTTKKCSLNGKCGFDLGPNIKIGASDKAIVQVKFGNVAKAEIPTSVLLQALKDRKLNLNHEFIKQVRRDKKKVLCLITGVVRTGEGHISKDTEKNANVGASAKILLPVSANASVNVDNNRKLDLKSNTALAYNIIELDVDLKDGSMKIIMEKGLHGGFQDPVEFDDASSSDEDMQDSQCPEEVFQAILDLPEKDRNKLTSIILNMMSAPRDIQIFAQKVKKLESRKTKNILVQELEEQLLIQKESWLYLLELAEITVQVLGELTVPRKVTPLLKCFGLLFDALSELEEEELDLIGKCAPETVPALFATFKAGLSNMQVTLNEVETISKDDKAIELLKQLGYSVSDQEILPPKDNLLTIDEVYVVMFALWGQKSK